MQVYFFRSELDHSNLTEKRALYTVNAVYMQLEDKIIYDLSTGVLPSQDYVRITLQIVSIT